VVTRAHERAKRKGGDFAFFLTFNQDLVLQLKRINNIIRTQPLRIPTPTHTHCQRIRTCDKRTRWHRPGVDFAEAAVCAARHAS